jgi:hypothetical protein
MLGISLLQYEQVVRATALLQALVTHPFPQARPLPQLLRSQSGLFLCNRNVTNVFLLEAVHKH